MTRRLFQPLALGPYTLAHRVAMAPLTPLPMDLLTSVLPVFLFTKLHPLAVLLMFTWFPVQDPALRIAGVLFACAPMMSIYPIVGQRFGLAGRCAAALLGATVLSFLTISAFIGLLGGPLG